MRAFLKAKAAARCAAFATICCLTSVLAAAEPEVPGLNELIVYDPGVHEKGLPSPQITEDGQVDVPPALHIHRYYYTGDKEFQGPLIAGGPTVVVARHPETGEHVYVDVMLPPGAPKIAHDEHGITYVYEDQRVVIQFTGLLTDEVLVKNLSGRGLGRALREHTENLGQSLREHHESSRVTQAVGDLARDTAEIAKGAAGVVQTGAGMAVERARATLKILPGARLLESLGEQAEERQAVERLRQAGGEQQREAREFIRSVR